MSIHRTMLTFMCCLFLAACGGGTSEPSRASDPEQALRDATTALQKTILEGAIAGAGTGSGIGFALGGREGAEQGARIGTLTGLTAGSYVAFIQRKYILRGSKLKQVLKDLEDNNALLQATVIAMQGTLAKSQAELAAAQAASAADQAREASEAAANLAQMQTAIARAETRQAEFEPVRALNLGSRDGRSVNGDMAILADRIAQMRAVATQMQTLM